MSIEVSHRAAKRRLALAGALGALLLGVVLFARGGLIGLMAGREVAHD